MKERSCNNCKFRKDRVDIVCNGTTGTVSECLKGNKITLKTWSEGCEKYEPNRITRIKNKLREQKQK